MNRVPKIRSVVVKQVAKWMIIVLTRVKVWILGSTLLPTISILQTTITSQHPPPPTAFPSAPGCIPHKPKKKWNMNISFVPGSYLIFLFWQKQTNILKVEPEISWTTTYMKRESEKE